MQNFPSDVLNQVRDHFEEEKRRVAGRINELTAQDPFANPGRSNDAASDTDASEEVSHDRFAAMVDELKGRLGEIDGALARIAEGTYGFCTVCNEMIDTDRLAILPTATLCLRHEKEKNQTGNSKS